MSELALIEVATGELSATEEAISEALWSQTATSLTLAPGMPYEVWEGIGEQLGYRDRSVRWQLGDWLNYGERMYANRYTQALNKTGLEVGTLYNYASVANRVPVSRRRESLTWSHHEAVASVKDPQEQIRLLLAAEANHWTVTKLRDERDGLTDRQELGEAEPAQAAIEGLSEAEETEGTATLQYLHSPGLLLPPGAPVLLRKWLKNSSYSGPLDKADFNLWSFIPGLYLGEIEGGKGDMLLHCWRYGAGMNDWGTYSPEDVWITQEALAATYYEYAIPELVKYREDRAKWEKPTQQGSLELPGSDLPAVPVIDPLQAFMDEAGDVVLVSGLEEEEGGESAAPALSPTGSYILIDNELKERLKISAAIFTDGIIHSPYLVGSRLYIVLRAENRPSGETHYQALRVLELDTYIDLGLSEAAPIVGYPAWLKEVEAKLRPSDAYAGLKLLTVPYTGRFVATGESMLFIHRPDSITAAALPAPEPDQNHTETSPERVSSMTAFDLGYQRGIEIFDAAFRDVFAGSDASEDLTDLMVRFEPDDPAAIPVTYWKTVLRGLAGEVLRLGGELAEERDREGLTLTPLHLKKLERLVEERKERLGDKTMTTQLLIEMLIDVRFDVAGLTLKGTE